MTNNEIIKEFSDKIADLLQRYSHLHKWAEVARKSTEECADGTLIEMTSVWDALSLQKNRLADYTTMNTLQDNIEVIAKEQLLTELEKDLGLLVREMEEKK